MCRLAPDRGSESQALIGIKLHPVKIRSGESGTRSMLLADMATRIEERCPTLDGPNLATALAHAHKSFAGFVEKNSPRKHKPWESFANARETEREMDQFPAAFSKLPAVSFVIPDNGHDMHDGSVEQADTWIEAQIAPYARWAARTNSLLVVTFDEASLLFGNHIFTLFYGAHVKPGRYPDRIDHYDVLRTLIDIARLTPFGKAAKRQPITSVWASGSKANQRSCF